MKPRGTGSTISVDISRMIDVIVNSLLRRHLISYQEKEDYHQDLVLFFLEHCQEFATERELVFISLKNAALNIVKHLSYRSHLSLDDFSDYSNMFVDHNFSLNQIEKKIEVDNLLRNLNEIDKLICTSIINDMSIKEITQIHSISKSSIYRRLDSLKYKK